MVMPDHITRELLEHVRLKRGGRSVLEGATLIARAHKRVSICFIDMCDFTTISSALSPQDVVRFLGEFFTLLDRISDKYPNITKIKTIGDSYFAAAGLSDADDHNEENDLEIACANMCTLLAFCLEAQAAICAHRFCDWRRNNNNNDNNDNDDNDSADSADNGSLARSARFESIFGRERSFHIRLRIGVHCGDVVAGIVGKKQPQYDIWGSACNMASRVEASAINGTIQVSYAVRALLQSHAYDGNYRFKKRHLTLKGIGRTVTYTLYSKDSKDIEMRSVSSWQFRVFRLSEEEQLDVVMSMFQQLGVLEVFGVGESTLRSFVIALRASYEANPYHNFTHAVDVTQAMFVVMTTMKQRRRLRPLDVFAIMIASLCHDCGHPGRTNAYLIATKSPLADGCPDTSVLERHHCATAFELMRTVEPGLLSTLTRDDRAQFRRAVEVSILATDMAKHGTFMDQIAAFIATRPKDASMFDSENPEHRELLMITWLKFCDISNVFRRHSLAFDWMTRITEEYNLQGDEMLSRGMPVPEMMNRNRATPAQETTRGFILAVVVPFFDRCIQPLISPSQAKMLRRHMMNNEELMRTT